MNTIKNWSRTELQGNGFRPKKDHISEGSSRLVVSSLGSPLPL